MSVLEDVKTILTTETTVYIDSYPDTRSKIASLHLIGGYNTIKTVENGKLKQPTFMVRVRDDTYNEGYKRCEEIVNTIDDIVNEDVNGTFYTRMELIGNINSIGKDEWGQSIFTMNFYSQHN